MQKPARTGRLSAERRPAILVPLARRETCTGEKAAVAGAAVEVVAGARVLPLDGSTTNLELARLLPETRVGTVLTNSPPIAVVLGVCALHPEVGLTTDDLAGADVRRATVESSGEVVALTTSDKLRAASAYLVSPVQDVTHLVAEPDVPDGLLDPYRALGLSVARV
jgi:DeoR/GlpR family transcriptional regulator of sugar metabolism